MSYPVRQLNQASLTEYFNRQRSDTGAWEYAEPGFFSESGPYQTYLEVMDSVSGRRTTGMHACRHYKRTLSVNRGYCQGFTKYINGSTPPTLNDVGRITLLRAYVWHIPNITVSGGTAYGTYGHWDNPILGLPVLGGWNAELGLQCPAPDIGPLLGRAVYAMLPGIKPLGGLSLVNSVIELKDFRRLPTTISRVRSLLSSRGGQSLLKLAKASPGLALRKLLRTGSDVYLQKEFNIDPLVSDICGIRSALLGVKDQLNRLVRYANTPRKRHYKCQLPGYVGGSHYGSGVTNTAYLCRTSPYSRSVSYGVSEFNATMEYSYTLPSWVKSDSTLSALLDALGVNLNPAIIWNAIPWSFVVDWVLGVSRWLDQFKRRIIEPQVTIRGACYSWHISRNISVSAGLLSQAPVSTLSEEVYVRSLFSVDANSLRASGLNSHEFSLAVALLFSR